MTRLQQIEGMLREDPNDPFLNYALALEYAKINEVEKAIVLIETILNKDENYLGAYYKLGKYYEETLQTEKAVAIYQKGIEIAEKQKNKKAQGELNEALQMLED
jgi:Tfp pilus assembly protein PilF